MPRCCGRYRTGRNYSEKEMPMDDAWFFVSDLHGRTAKYEKLFDQIEKKRPRAVFFGGDLLPSDLVYRHSPGSEPVNFVHGYLAPAFARLQAALGEAYPEVFIILGNDDPRTEEAAFLEYEPGGLWHYMHMKKASLGSYTVYGYSMVPPTPFMLKDWERYDVSRYVDPGCIHPHEGYRTVPPDGDVEFMTIREDLQRLAGTDDLSRAVFLFHSPPYQTALDRAGLDGVRVDHVPVDVHVGSMAMKQFIETRKPLLTLHGHIHESAKLTGAWQERIGNTLACTAAHDGSGLALVQFRERCLSGAERMIL